MALAEEERYVPSKTKVHQNLQQKKFNRSDLPFSSDAWFFSLKNLSSFFSPSGGPLLERMVMPIVSLGSTRIHQKKIQPAKVHHSQVMLGFGFIKTEFLFSFWCSTLEKYPDMPILTVGFIRTHKKCST